MTDPYLTQILRDMLSRQIKYGGYDGGSRHCMKESRSGASGKLRCKKYKASGLLVDEFGAGARRRRRVARKPRMSMMGMGARRMRSMRASALVGGKKPQSAWIKGVKKYMKDHGVSYKVALQKYSKIY